MSTNWCLKKILLVNSISNQMLRVWYNKLPYSTTLHCLSLCHNCHNCTKLQYMHAILNTELHCTKLHLSALHLAVNIMDAAATLQRPPVRTRHITCSLFMHTAHIANTLHKYCTHCTHTAHIAHTLHTLHTLHIE